jgi:hypothetical protein
MATVALLRSIFRELQDLEGTYSSLETPSEDLTCSWPASVAEDDDDADFLRLSRTRSFQVFLRRRFPGRSTSASESDEDRQPRLPASWIRTMLWSRFHESAWATSYRQNLILQKINIWKIKFYHCMVPLPKRIFVHRRSSFRCIFGSFRGVLSENFWA